MLFGVVDGDSAKVKNTFNVICQFLFARAQTQFHNNLSP